jgi:hypothetical protein
MKMLDDITRRVVSLNTPAEHWDGNGIFLRVVLGRGKRGGTVGAARLLEGPRVTRNLSVGPPGLDLVGASPLGPSRVVA